MKVRTLLVEKDKETVCITIDRQDKLNALSIEVFEDLRSVVLGCQKIPEIRALIIKGSGHKAFASGVDIQAMSEMSLEESKRFIQLAHEVNLLIEDSRFPVIACVDGYALGGGCELAMSCDFIYATEHSHFGFPEVDFGIIPAFGGCMRLSRYIGVGKAKEIIFTGKIIKSRDAIELGLVNRVFSCSELMLEAAEETIQKIISKSPMAIATCKSVMNESVGLTTQEAIEREKNGFVKVFDTDDRKEGLAAFLEKREASFIGK